MRFALIMEEIENGSYQDQIKRRSPDSHYSNDEIWSILYWTVEAFELAARYKIFHRDIKPGNILVSNLGMPKITDFGESLRIEDKNSSKLAGTPSFFSYKL